MAANPFCTRVIPRHTDIIFKAMFKLFFVHWLFMFLENAKIPVEYKDLESRMSDMAKMVNIFWK